MRRIRLLTSDGRHVAYVEIPQFLRPGPKVVMWGIRTFVATDESEYVEVFAVASLTPSPGLAGPT